MFFYSSLHKCYRPLVSGCALTAWGFICFSALSLASPEAFALDSKSYSPIGCQYWTSGENTARENMGVSQLGWIRNKSSSEDLGVVCPLIRDSMDHDIKNVVVYGMLSGSRDTKCDFRVLSVAKGALQSALVYDTKIRLQRIQQGEPVIGGRWSNIDIEDNDSSRYSYSVFCQLAPGHSLTQIYVEEVS